MEIAGKRIVVTGATGGLGQAIARHLAGSGARLVLTGRRAEQLEALASEVEGEALVADLASPAGVAAVAEAASAADVLVANAGVGGDPPLPELTPEDIDFALDVNLRSPVHLSVRFAQACLASGRPGQLVLVGSLSGLAASPGTRLYNATKFGLRGFSLSLRQDLEHLASATSPVGVTLVVPGFIRDAGMYADGGIDLPPGVRTKTPSDVARGVERAIRSNPAEVYVSPAELRLASTFATLAPAISAAVQRRLKVAERITG